MRLLYAGVGLLALSLGILGAFLPLLPTTVFVLIAAYCFARSSERFYRALLHSRFGPAIRKWQAHRCISLRSKIYAIALIVLSFAITVGFFVEALHLRIGLATFGLLLAIYLYSLPTCPPEE